MIKDMFTNQPNLNGIFGWSILYSLISLIAVGISYFKNSNLTLVPFALIVALTLMVGGYKLECDKDG